MQGLIITKSGKTYLFRDDHGHDPCFWAWDIHENGEGDRLVTHKWKKLPKQSFVCEFDLEKPPKTVSFIPII